LWEDDTRYACREKMKQPTRQCTKVAGKHALRIGSISIFTSLAKQLKRDSYTIQIYSTYLWSSPYQSTPKKFKETEHDNLIMQAETEA
jgi:hypothetical protein